MAMSDLVTEYIGIATEKPRLRPSTRRLQATVANLLGCFFPGQLSLFLLTRLKTSSSSPDGSHGMARLSGTLLFLLVVLQSNCHLLLLVEGACAPVPSAHAHQPPLILPYLLGKAFSV